MAKVKLNVYYILKIGPDAGSSYIAAKEDSVASRYLNQLEEQLGDGTKFDLPMSIGTIELDISGSQKEAGEGKMIIKLGGLEHISVR